MQGQPNARTRQLPVRKTGGEIVHATVDEIDWLWARSYKWHLNEGYAARSQRRGENRKLFRISLHREILGLKHGYQGQVVDHINGVRLDNRRTNLRVVTMRENGQNKPSYKGSSSKYRGVSWWAPYGKWRVQIMVDGHRTFLGAFEDENEAGRVAAEFYAQYMPHARML